MGSELVDWNRSVLKQTYSLEPKADFNIHIGTQTSEAIDKLDIKSLGLCCCDTHRFTQTLFPLINYYKP